MRSFLLTLAICCGGATAQADGYVIHANTVNITSAQQDADQMARTGILRHCGRANGRREGIGMSSASPDAALRSCCYFGRYRIVEKAVAWSPVRRAWFAVIRYAD
jgi:hypothetical protein